jgi:hypothetical protein
LTKHGALDILKNMRVHTDEQMNLMAREVCEKVSEYMDEHLLVDHDFKQEIEDMSTTSEKN